MSLNPCCCGRWSQRNHLDSLLDVSGRVLILVVVEDGLRGIIRTVYPIVIGVLILVVVEDGLRVKGILLYFTLIYVLILVVVEDGLRVTQISVTTMPIVS